jgi:methyltransferase (TIGR00027 family)
MDVKLTAFAIARIRAQESSLGARLFADPYATLFDDLKVDVDPLFHALPFFREHVRLRTRFFDDWVRAELSRGVRQVVLLGAGFDCRAMRMTEIAEARPLVLEVDHEAQIAAKRERFREANIEVPGYVRSVGADLSSEDLTTSLGESLRAVGFDENAPTTWVCEGLVGYLSPPAVSRMLTSTARLGSKGSSMVLNHSTFTYARDVLLACLTESGWTPAAAPSFAELHVTHLGTDVPAGSDAFGLVAARR